MSLPQATLEALISQYRGEVSAVEAYERAITKFDGQPEELALRRMQAEHHNAVKRLGQAIHENGGVLPESSGAWGTVVNAVEKLAAMVNDEVPLQVLYRGESVGVQGYEDLLKNHTLPDGLTLDLAGLLSRCRSHLESLKAMIDALPAAPTRPML